MFGDASKHLNLWMGCLDSSGRDSRCKAMCCPRPLSFNKTHYSCWHYLCGAWPGDPVQHHEAARGPGVHQARPPDRVHQPPVPGAVLDHAAVTRALKHHLVPWPRPGVWPPDCTQPAALILSAPPGLYHGLVALDKLPEHTVRHSHPHLVAGHGHPAARVEKKVFVILEHHPWSLNYEVLWKSIKSPFNPGLLRSLLTCQSRELFWLQSLL